VGHNWFYGILGSNERAHAWMDEGLNSFFQFRYEAEKYRSNSIFGSALPAELKQRSPSEFLAIVYNALNEIPMRDAIETASEDFKNKDEYGIVIYLKTAIWAYILEQELGRPVFDKAIHSYYEQWKFRHPYPEDFKQVLETVSNRRLDELFARLKEKGKLL
jgi:aminopeptidase N